ncbi:MAG: hypothetical protein ACRDDY_14035 [Clostridium sp.]|uniref:hypothetical protein n=1 Tax=Clostridium sp. TaxID=1506 RepID=UPI003EE61288
MNKELRIYMERDEVDSLIDEISRNASKRPSCIDFADLWVWSVMQAIEDINSRAPFSLDLVTSVIGEINETVSEKMEEDQNDRPRDIIDAISACRVIMERIITTSGYVRLYTYLEDVLRDYDFTDIQIREAEYSRYCIVVDMRMAK